MDKIKPFIFGDCKIQKIQKKNYFDWFMDYPDYDSYYDAKVELIIVEGEEECRKPVNILVFANNIKDALIILLSNLESFDCEVIGIKKTGITDILKQD